MKIMKTMSQNEGLDSLAKETIKLKQELSELKQEMTDKIDSLNPEEKNDLHTVTEFVDHFNDCSKDDCEIHNLKERESKAWFVKGIHLGKKLASQ